MATNIVEIFVKWINFAKYFVYPGKLYYLCPVIRKWKDLYACNHNKKC
jgi:hypothetical protein